MPQVQTSGDVMELKGLRRKVPEELGPEVTRKLGGPVKAADVFFDWTRGFANDPELKVLLAAYQANFAAHHTRQMQRLNASLSRGNAASTSLGCLIGKAGNGNGAPPLATQVTQVNLVRYLVGGPSVLTAEDLARQDDEIARKTDGVMLSSDMVQKAHRNLVNVIRDSGCSKDVVEEATQRMLELHEGWKQVRAHPMKKQTCACCSVQ